MILKLRMASGQRSNLEHFQENIIWKWSQRCVLTKIQTHASQNHSNNRTSKALKDIGPQRSQQKPKEEKFLSQRYLISQKEQGKVVSVPWSYHSASIKPDSEWWPGDSAIPKRTSISRTTDQSMYWVAPVGQDKSPYPMFTLVSHLCFQKWILNSLREWSSQPLALLPSMPLFLH